MDDGLVTPVKDRAAATAAAETASWKLAPAIAAETQGLVANGFSSLTRGRALLLNLSAIDTTDGARGAWLVTLHGLAPVTPALPPTDLAAPTFALAFSWTGLKIMGLPDNALASFLGPFREGMLQEDRARRLGDRRKEVWQKTVLENGPLWSANVPPAPKADQVVGAYDVKRAFGDSTDRTRQSVHAALMLYAIDDVAAADLAQRITQALLPHGVTVARQLDLTLDIEPTRVSNEHFGFADGLSQPIPYDEDGGVLQNNVPVKTPHPVHGVPLGEILLGHINGHHEVAPGPVVESEAPPGNNRPADAGLTLHPKAEGFYDLGRNGSYLVIRELKQDVAAFWQSMETAAATIRARDPAGAPHVTADWLAARVVGRNRDGHMLCPVSPDTPDGLRKPANDLPDSDYLFLADDPVGYGCPRGSHVRRANPRDALAAKPGQGPTLLHAANNHRILRRGRKYGPKVADMHIPDGADRGLLFMCLNTDIARQFEFIQTTWLLNPSFDTLFEEVDPLLGPAGPMTIPGDPLRRRIKVATFVQMVGGDYFFLPSLPALRYLALL